MNNIIEIIKRVYSYYCADPGFNPFTKKDVMFYGQVLEEFSKDPIH